MQMTQIAVMEETKTEKALVSPLAERDTRTVGEGVGFERIRRITGYLVGTLDRFNDAKRAEVTDRVKHTIAPPRPKQL